MKTTKYSSWMIQKRDNKSEVTDGRHFEKKSKTAISQQRFERSP